MPKPYRLQQACPLPADAEIIDHEGRPHVRLKERGRPVLYPLSKDGTKYLRPQKRWYFDVRGADGTVRRVKGFADLKATEQLAAEMERKAARARAGLFDPAEEHLRRPLAEHLRDYAAALDAKGNTTEYNKEVVAKISAMFAGCGFAFVADVDAAKVSAWLADLRRPGRVADIPPGESFASSQVATMLGLDVGTVRRFVARHRLPTVGRGPARRLTRAAVVTIAETNAKGIGPATVNHYIRAARGFFRWMLKAKRIGADPLEALTFVNTSVDVRRARRELTADELQRLLAGTRTSPRIFRGLTGEDRYLLYLVAAGTGFRANALANLTPADFDLDAPSPVVTLAARFAKNRRTKVQPLPLDVADALRDYLAGRPANAIIWGGTWAKGCAGAEMLRRDLDAAGIAYAVEGPDGPEYADFHSLRHTYLTMLGRHGVDLRTVQELAGHSTPLLTARYSHRRLYDLSGAVGKLPPLVPASPEVVAVPLARTGTDAEKIVVPAVVPAVGTADIGLHRDALKYTDGTIERLSEDSPQPVEMKGAGACLHRPASLGIATGELGFEPRQADPESAVLPLHHSPSQHPYDPSQRLHH